MKIVPTLPSASNRFKKNSKFLILVALSVISFIAAAGIIYDYKKYCNDELKTTKAELKAFTVKATQDIELILREAMQNADTIANDLTSDKLGKTDMLEKMEAVLLKNSIYYGVSISYRQYGFDPAIKLYAPYYYKVEGDEGRLEYCQVEDSYDYTTEFHWFIEPMKEGNQWSEPYWDPAGKVLMVTYSSVFYDQDRNSNKKVPLGVVTIDISLDAVKKIFEDIDLGASGFGGLISSKGVYIYHPNYDFVVSQKTIIEVALEKNDQDRLYVADKAANGEGGIVDHISTTTLQESWLVFEPIPISGWSLQNTFLKNDLEIDIDLIRHKLINIVVFVLNFLMFLLACFYIKIAHKIRYKWMIVGFGSFIILFAIASIWNIALRYNPADEIKGARISDIKTLQKKITDYNNRSEELQLAPPLLVPTGVYLDAIKFTDPSDVLLSGYIWQKYNDDFPKDIKKEFIISKATEVDLQEINTASSDGHETVQYHFTAKIRQKFNHKTYPLEEGLIELRLINKAFDQNILLIPDLDSYKIRSASILPGINKGVFIDGWKLMNSYYEFRTPELNTDFGISQSVEQENFPDLYFIISIQRNFIDAFISNLTPLIIVATMLFFLLLLGDRLDPDTVFSVCVAMFFVIVFSHLDIRSKISSQEIFYLEYFFLLTYGSIVYVIINAIGILLKANFWYYRYKSKMPALLFWPLLLSFIFGITLFTFY